MIKRWRRERDSNLRRMSYLCGFNGVLFHVEHLGNFLMPYVIQHIVKICLVLLSL